MSGYNDITVRAKHYANPTRTFRTDSEIEFKDTGIVFACGGHKYAIEYYKVISIVPVKED